jgi:hypothetical protein
MSCTVKEENVERREINTASSCDKNRAAGNVEMSNSDQADKEKELHPTQTKMRER